MISGISIPWLDPFRSAIKQRGSEPLVLSLATVDAEGHPQVRSVVCRRVEEEGALWMTSDARSGKNAELAREPRAAAVGWFPATREQFRFAGSVQILPDASTDEAVAGLWRELGPRTRATFDWPAPGQPRNSADSFAQSSDSPDPPATFTVLVLRPTEVDWLRLATHPHQRVRWRAAEGWVAREVNP